MRLVTWNAYRGPIASRLSRLSQLQPDLVVLQECSSPSLFDDAIWAGPRVRQGVAIAAANPAYRLTRVDDATYDDGPGAIARVDGPPPFLVAGVWTRKAKSRSYIAHALTWLEHHRRELVSLPLVVMGDFNASPASPNQRKEHLEMLRRFREQFGIVSAYHAFHGVEHGEETHPTHYWRRHEDEPWHIDFCFIPEEWVERLRSVEVGGYSDWADSDHRPVVVDLCL